MARTTVHTVLPKKQWILVRQQTLHRSSTKRPPKKVNVTNVTPPEHLLYPSTLGQHKSGDDHKSTSGFLCLGKQSIDAPGCHRLNKTKRVVVALEVSWRRPKCSDWPTTKASGTTATRHLTSPSAPALAGGGNLQRDYVLNPRFGKTYSAKLQVQAFVTFDKKHRPQQKTRLPPRRQQRNRSSTVYRGLHRATVLFYADFSTCRDAG